jgi:M6 family metalloprotease-like protein
MHRIQLDLTVGLIAVCAATSAAWAQEPGADLRERAARFFAAELPGPKFGHAWLGKVRSLQAARQAALQEVPQPPPGRYNLRGVFGMLVIPGTYSDVTPRYSPAQYDAAFFAPTGTNAYTLRQYYAEVSGDQFTFGGAVLPWIQLPQTRAYYIDNFSNGGRGRFVEYIRDLLVIADATVDWRLYDNDGPDDVPNSGDDDGYVDMVAFLHPLADGVCRRDALGGPVATGFRLEYLGSFNGQPFTTRVTGFNGQLLKVDDFILSAGLHCNGTAISTMNINVHEMGHALGLPDLYDLDQSSFGVGVWDVMGYGLYAAEGRPAHFGAWTRRQLGWNTIFPLTLDSSYQLDPAETARTALQFNVAGTQESFLLENRQRLVGDLGLPGGGLLIWHLDDAVMLPGVQAYRGNEDENHPGLAVVQADGRRDLAVKTNRGDAGDPFPGSQGNTAFSVGTNPAPVTYTGAFAGIAVDSIRSVAPNGPVAFRVRVGGLTVVRASDTAAVIAVDDTTYHVFRNLWGDGSMHTIAFPDSQLPGAGRTRYTWVSWSDGGAKSHDVTDSVTGATYEATVAREHRLTLTATADGTVASDPPVEPGGTLLAEGTPVTVTATPNTGFVFDGWTGDTSTAHPSLALSMARPFTLTATFATPLVLTSVAVRPNGVMGAPYSDTLEATGGGGGGGAWTRRPGRSPGARYRRASR